MGVTATGLLLLRVVDPEYKSPAADAFACKQVLHEPFMGGGLWTSAAIPLLVLWGGWPVFGIACGAMAFWLLLVFVLRPWGRGELGFSGLGEDDVLSVMDYVRRWYNVDERRVYVTGASMATTLSMCTSFPRI